MQISPDTIMSQPVSRRHAQQELVGRDYHHQEGVHMAQPGGMPLCLPQRLPDLGWKWVEVATSGDMHRPPTKVHPGPLCCLAWRSPGPAAELSGGPPTAGDIHRPATMPGLEVAPALLS